MAVKWTKSLQIGVWVISGAIAASISGCGGGADEDGVLINGDFPIIYAQRNTEALGNPTDGVRFSPGGDLYMKNVSAPLSESTNLTSSYTRGAGDVSDQKLTLMQAK